MKHFGKTVLWAMAATILATQSLAQDLLRFASFEPPVGFVTSQILTP